MGIWCQKDREYFVPKSQGLGRRGGVVDQVGERVDKGRVRIGGEEWRACRSVWKREMRNSLLLLGLR